MRVTALGVAPDYDFLLENYTHTAANAEQFGIAFVSDEGYAVLRDANRESAEDYLYAYTLPDDMTHAQLKTMIDGFDFDYNDIENPYIRELLDSVYGTQSLLGGLAKLSGPVGGLLDGLLGKLGELLCADFTNISFFLQRDSNPRIGA